jgi:uncharacterized RDD family membrane protein YckC
MMPWVATVKARGRRPLGRLRLRIIGDVFDLLVAWLVIPGLVASSLRWVGVEGGQATLRIGWTVVLIYTVVPVAITGATLGKKLVGQRIERYSIGAVPGVAASFVRYVVATGAPIAVVGSVVPALAGPVSMLGLAWFLVILLSIVADTERRGVHDKVAGTVVVGRQRQILTH